MARKPDLLTLSNSSRGCLHECHQKWWFRYRERLQTPREAFPLRWGTAWHAGMEAGKRAVWASGKPEPEAALPASLEAAGAALEAYCQASEQLRREDKLTGDELQEALAEAADGWAILTWALPHYWQATAGDHERYVPLLIEDKFALPVLDARGKPAHVSHRGRLDEVLWDHQHGVIVVREHKSTSDSVLSFENKLGIDPQAAGYLDAVRYWPAPLRTPDGTVIAKAGTQYAVGRVQYDVVRRKRPTEPVVLTLKKGDGKQIIGFAGDELAAELVRRLARQEGSGVAEGLVSTNKAIDTTADVYSAALEAQLQRGLAVTTDQQDMLDRLKQNADNFYARLEYHRGDLAELERWRREVWEDARTMRGLLAGRIVPVRNQGHCTGPMSRRCEYMPVCRNDVPETRALYVTKQEDLNGEKTTE